MKKSVFLATTLLCCLAGALRVSAQSVVNFGPKVGVNYTNLLSSDNRLKEDAFVGLAGGAFLRLNLGKWYVQPEGYFTTKGTNFNFSSNSSNNDAQASGKVRLTSLDVPVLLGYKLIDNKAFNLRILGGPLASFVLKENRNDLSLLNSQSYTYNKSNIGFQVGAGIDIGNLTFDARYESGLNKINSTFNQRPSLLQFSVGFKIF